ncbi:sensor histidine kinase [Brevibacillus sp. B_LB10_24]|uniref:sensor histidine kinase n=1 Tax=Brevibacillus sp. B_LB10_24 TaxID=3380645 RepID=UPI0038BD8470
MQIRLITQGVIIILVMSVGSFALNLYLSRYILRPVIQTITDITERGEQETKKQPVTAYVELKSFIDQYEKAIQNKQQLIKNREEFNAYASHELRNSLAVINAKIEVIGEDDPKRALAEVKEYSAKLVQTVDNLLTLSADRIAGNNGLVDLALVVASAVDEYQSIGASIDFLLEDGEFAVESNEVWLYRAISNLLDNARKYAGAKKRIAVHLRERAGAVILTVQDEGTGIPKREWQNIWKPYYTTDKGERGKGVGLAFVDHVVRLSGGDVWVESSELQGTTFYLSFPKATA